METATQALHRLTSYTWDWYEPSREDDDLVWSVPVDDSRVVRDLVTNDVDRFPWFYKRYQKTLLRVPLPRDLPATTASAIDVLAGTADVSPIELDLPHLSRLLHLSAGVVRTKERSFATWLFRAAGSAGGRFPLEVYVAVPDGLGLPAGLHWYDPLDHALVQVGPPPRGHAPALVVSGVPWRTGWRYRERGYRHVYWDAGTMLSQLLAVADSAGLDPRLHTHFPDAEVAELVGADGVHEWPVAIVGSATARRRSRRPLRPQRARSTRRRSSSRSSRLLSERASGTCSGLRGISARRSRCRTGEPNRSRRSCSRAGRRGAWTRPATCR